MLYFPLSLVYSLLALWPMEAGGIEPPSRDISTTASTCVVANLFLVRLDPWQRGSQQTNQELCLAFRVLGVTVSDPDLLPAFGRFRRAPSARAA